MASSYTNGIVIWLYGRQELHEKQFNRDFTAEELCLMAAKHCEITSLTLPLFALVRSDHVTWLTPQDTVKCSDTEVSHIYFRVRTKPHLQNLKFTAERDSAAFCYLFHQIEQDFIEERLAGLYDAKITTDLALGFSVIDMVRIAKEKDMDVERLLSQHSHKQFLPKKAVEAFRWPWRHLKLKLNFRSELQTMYQEKQSLKAIDLMMQYVNGMYKCVPNYATEQFLIVLDGQTSDKVVVDPFHPTMPGLYYQNKNEHICTLNSILDLCLSMSEFNNWNVQIDRRDGMPTILTFPEKDSARSFIALVDSYYRMSVHYYQHLCTEVRTRFVDDLNKMKCHGPEDFNWVNERLPKSSEAGTYLLKMKRKEYESYVLFVTNRRPLFIKKQKENEKFVLYLNESDFFPDEGCQSLMELLTKIKQEEPRGLKLKRPIRPSEEGLKNSDLLLCKPPERILTEDEEDGLPRMQTKPVVVIRSEDLKGQETLAEGRFKVVSRGTWLGQGDGLVAIKQLKTKYKLDFAEEFQSVIDKVAFWHSPYIVQTYGVCLRGPLSVITELMPVGSLEELLRSKRPFKLYHAVSAAELVSQALMYLEENRFVHGSVRCCNMLVKEYDSDRILVKLSEPCMVGRSERIDKKLFNEIYAERFPWIDPLTYEPLVQASPSNDMFSFGVALWEMLSGGAYPLREMRGDIKKIKKFYVVDKNKLNTPTILNQSETDSDILAGNKRDLANLIGLCMDLEGNRLSSRDLLRDLRQIQTTIDPKSYDTVTSDGDDVTFANIDFDHPQEQVNGQEDETLQVRPIHSTTVSGNSANARPLPAPPTDAFVIDRAHLEILTEQNLGSGFYGYVKKGRWKDREGAVRDCAVKFLKSQHVDKYYEELRKEIKMMTILSHPNIAQIYGECPFDTLKLGLVMEFVALGSLKNYLLKKKAAVNGKLLDWSIEIAEGMKYLNEVLKPAVIHRDLAARNVLLTREERVKISDFGLAKALKDKDYYRTVEDKMPVLWCPPEALNECRFSTKSDVWSYGVTLWEIYSYGEKPNKGKLSPSTAHCEDQSLQDIFCQMIFNGSRLVKPDNAECTNGIYDVMKLCWYDDPEQRPTFSTIIDKLDQVKQDKDYPM